MQSGGSVMLQVPIASDLTGKTQFRIIPSVYPPINFFENLVEPSEMDTLLEIESLTNERLLQEVGNLFLVPPEDRVSGPGSSVVMAAFTHTGTPTRFTDGSFGIYYASMSLETAIRETVYHRERFLAATNEDPCEITMRVYEGKVLKPLNDIRSHEFQACHDLQDYRHSQSIGKELRQQQSWGVLYKSVRHQGGECIAAFRPPAVSIPIQRSHLRYVWNNEKITDVFGTNSILKFA
jgi:hypothetical protein